MNIRRNTYWILLGSLMPMVIGVATIPFIYQHVGIERIGVLTIIWALIGYFSLFDFGLGRVITQRIASLASHQREYQKKTIATTGFVLTFLIGLLGGVVGFSVIELVGVKWINSDPSLEIEIRSSFFLACLAIPATTATAGLRGVLEGEHRFKAVSLLRMLLGLSNFLGPTASIALFGPGLDYTVASMVIARYINLFAHQFCVRHAICIAAGHFSAQESMRLFKFGGWMTLSNIISPLLVVADRFLIANVLGAALVAYYTLPAEFMIRLLIVPAALSTTLFPVLSKELAEKNFTGAIALYKKSMKIIILVMGAVTAGVFIGAGFGFDLWLGHDFAVKSSDVASLLAVGVFFNSMAQIPYAFIQASGDARSTALFHVIELVFYIPVLLLLMKLFGILGAAMAWMLRALLDLALLHRKAMRLTA